MIWTALVGIVWSGGMWNVQGMLAVCGEVTKATEVTATRNPSHLVLNDLLVIASSEAFYSG